MNYDSSSKESSKTLSNKDEFINKPESSRLLDLNKSCQTSAVCMSNQYVQAEFSNNSKSNTNSSMPSSFLTSENVSSSFEYVKGNSTKIEKTEKEPKIKTEVELGIKLLCSLIDSNNLGISQKKKLAKSIVKRLTKTDNIDNILTSCNDSISETSLMNVKSFLWDVNEISNSKKEIENVHIKTTNNIASQTTLPLTTISPTETKEPLKSSNKVNIDNGYYNVVASEEINENFETRLKKIESELMKMNFYKNKLTSENSTLNKGDSRNLYDKKYPTRISHRGETILEKETRNYQENIYNPALNYRRSAHKNVHKTVLYDGMRNTHHYSTNIKINEKHSIVEGDERLKLRTPSSSLLTSTKCTSSYEMETNSLIDRKEFKQTANSNNHYSEPTAFEKFVPKHYIYETLSSEGATDVIIPYSCSSSSPECFQQQQNTKRIQTNDSNDNNKYDNSIDNKSLGYHKNRHIYSKHNQPVQVKPSSLAYVIEFKTKTGSSSNSHSSEESLTLQDFLKHERPEFYFKANQRQQILNEIRRLRYLRNEKLRNIIANESDMDKIELELKNLPPEPLSKFSFITFYSKNIYNIFIEQIRIFTSKTLRANTKKKYAQLPEVIEKRNKKKQDKILKDYRKLTHIFNKVKL